MHLLKAIGGFFTFWMKAGRKYRRLEEDENKRETSSSLGVRSIVQSVVCGALTVLALLGLYYCTENFVDIGNGGGIYPVLTIIGMVATAFIALAFFVQGVGGALVYMIYQFKLNKKSVRWVALAVWFLVIVAIVVFSALTFSKL